MALPRRLQRCTHLFSFLSVLASSRNGTRSHSIRPVFHLGNRGFSSTASLSAMRNISHGASAKAYKKLQLQPKDRETINEYYDKSKPKALRTEEDFLKALRQHGYVPAIDRVDEMLDSGRSPFQSKDQFDKITLGLLLRSAKSANGNIRNPYRVPGRSAGQNPVVTNKGTFAKPAPVSHYLLFPDDTNWTFLSEHFPLREPPRPWHPVAMVGLQQDYTREEVARRLEWSQVQNAKKIRNGYGWPSPDPNSYKYLGELPPPPPPVIRECNLCKRPRYLMRFWNFFVQRWQHVAAPHRPSDCGGHSRGMTGRLMYAPKGTKIGGLLPSKVEDKEWIEEETAVRLLFRCGFIELPTVNKVIGNMFAEAAINDAKLWPWARAGDVKRWALRGGRKNGLLDLSAVQRTAQIEDARKEQQSQFLEENREFLEKVREILKEHPIKAEDLAKIPLGQFYPKNHQAVDAWQQYELEKFEAHRSKTRSAAAKKSGHQKLLKKKLEEIDEALKQVEQTKAEIVMIEGGLGESWISPGWSRLATHTRAEQIMATDGILVSEKLAHPPPPAYSRWRSGDPVERELVPRRWMERAAGSNPPEDTDSDDTVSPTNPGLAVTNPGFSANPPDIQSQISIKREIRASEGPEKLPAFTKAPEDLFNLYQDRFIGEMRAKGDLLNPEIDSERIELERIRSRVEGRERKAIEREEAAFRLREAFLWSNSRGGPGSEPRGDRRTEPENVELTTPQGAREGLEAADNTM
ncbi:hypothetical protein TWF481_005062 [Arthrobotrys musiformis]|uniref:Uncharacterized protein n=1 Tax=Arthrobotrys musiformis TaxID=47236 RepID=A0AAV9WEK9_9PEZI